MTGPSVLFGAIAKATDWSKTDYPYSAPTGDCAKVVLPLSLQYLTPKGVAFFGLGAVSAAVMSSTDSSMLSASTMIARNFYQIVIRPKASDREIIWVLWACIIVNCCSIRHSRPHSLLGDIVLVINIHQINDIFVSNVFE